MKTRATLVVAALVAVCAGVQTGGSVSSPSLRLSEFNSLGDTFGGIVPAGDLNGDGHGDVLDERVVNRGIVEVASIVARDGRTGRAIWRWHHAVQDASTLSALPGRVGASRRRGVLILFATDKDSGATVISMSALSGRSGHELWRRQVGSGPDGDIELVEKTHDLPGADMDLVVAVADEGPRSLLEPVIVNGMNGHLVRLPAHPGVGEPEVALYSVPDLDGNGLDDLVLSRGGPHPGIVAEDGRTGRVLWALHGSGFRSGNAIVTSVGRLTGSRDPDLIVTTNPPGFKGRQVQTLVQGSNGHILWSKRADEVLPVRRAGPHLDAAVDLVDDLHPAKGHAGAAGISVRAYTPRGHLIYKTTVTVPTSKPPLNFAQETVGIAGDFQPDGAKDVQVSVFSSPRHHKIGWINGRTGHFHVLPFLAFPVGHLSPQRGTDLVDLKPRGNHGRRLMLTGVSATHHVFWRRVLRVPANYDGQVVSLHASSGECADIAVTDDDFPGGQVAAVYTGSGHLLWTLRFSADASFGGQLSRRSEPKHPCANQ